MDSPTSAPLGRVDILRAICRVMHDAGDDGDEAIVDCLKHVPQQLGSRRDTAIRATFRHQLHMWGIELARAL